MFRIAELALGKSSTDCCFEFEYQGEQFEVQRFGANFSMASMLDMMSRLRNHVDAFALADIPPVISIKGKSFVHRYHLEIMSQPSSVPLCEGSRVRELASVNGMLNAIEQRKIDPAKGIFFPAGLLHTEIVFSLLGDYRRFMGFGDAYSLMGAPIILKPSAFLGIMAQLALNFASMKNPRNLTPMTTSRLKKIGRPILASLVQPYQYVLARPGFFTLFGDDLDFVRDKSVILPWSNPYLENKIRAFHPREIINLFPKSFRFSPNMTYSILDATLRLTHQKEATPSLEEWEAILSADIAINRDTRKFVICNRPSIQTSLTQVFRKVKQITRKEKPPDFAFVVHSLSTEDFFRLPGMGKFRALPPSWKKGLEEVIAKTPGFTYGHINNIVSKKTGKEINGIIYALLATPKMLKQESPDIIYKKIERLTHHAADHGAKIFGLGAYTKLVGDSGATINQNSPIPVTTGNSLSASATLWAVHEICLKNEYIKENPPVSLSRWNRYGHRGHGLHR